MEISKEEIEMSKEQKKIILSILKKVPRKILNSLLKNCYILDFTTKDMCHKYLFDDSSIENNVENCKKQPFTNTNPEFPQFRQTIFHAGSKEQFLKYANLLEKEKDKNKILKTFDYMFDHFKKGVYVSIRENSIKVYLPFSNSNYKNEWSHFLKAPKTYKKGSILTEKASKERNPNAKKFMLKTVHFLQKVPDIVAFARETDYVKNSKSKKDINNRPDQWYANNCIFRNTVFSYHGENGQLKGLPDEGDKSVANFLVFLTELCLHKTLPDIDFFVNPRDFPILKKDGTHPYSAIFKPHNKEPKITKDQNNFMPIFSQASSDEYVDICIPTDDDIVNFLQVVTMPGCNKPASFPTKEEMVPWSDKKPIAVFRGSATGCGIDDQVNHRIQLAYLSKATENLKNGPFLDVGLTSLNKRMKKDPSKDYCDYLNPKKYISSSRFNLDERFERLEPFQISDLVSKRMDDSETMSFKYIIDVDGHSAAFRLSRMLSFGSLILKVDSPWFLWFSKDLIGRYYDELDSTNYKETHYIKLKVSNNENSDKESVVDADFLIKTIEFLRKNDSWAKKIAKNGFEFYQKHLNKNSMFENFIQNFR